VPLLILLVIVCSKYLAVSAKNGLLQVVKKGRKRAVINNCMRSLCKTCKEKPCAVNYYRQGKIFYRKDCDSCARGATPKKARWAQAGYKKKDSCEKCGYRSKHPEQFNVYHVDGNLNNCRPLNLKTICANCQRTLQKEGVTWRQGDLLADY
jgi:hypothetical protein